MTTNSGLPTTPPPLNYQQALPNKTFQDKYQKLVLKVIDPRAELDPTLTEGMGKNPITNTLSLIPKALGNAAGEVGQMATGLLKLPGAVWDSFVHPEKGGQNVQNLIGGMATGVNRVFGEPVATDKTTGAPTGLQMPSLVETGQNLVKRPIGALSSMALANQAFNAGTNALTPKVDTEGNVTSGGMVNKLNKETATQVPNEPSNVQIGQYRTTFTAPPKVRDPDAVYSTMIKDKVAGNPEQIGDTVNGSLKETENLKYEALSNAQKNGVQVSIDDATSTAATEIQNSPAFAANPGAKQIWQQKLDALIPRKLSTLEGNIGGVDPIDAYKASTEIANEGWGLLKKSHDIHGTTINPEYEQVGEAYIKTADALSKSLDKALGTNPIPYTPEAIAAAQRLQQLNPLYSSRILASPTFQALRSGSADYVNMGHILDETARIAQGSGSQLSNMTTQSLSSSLAAAGGKIAGFPGRIATSAANAIIAPMVRQGANTLLPQFTTNAAIGSGQLSGVMGAAGNVLNAAKTAIPGVISGSLNQPEVEQIPNPGGTTIPGATPGKFVYPKSLSEIQRDPATGAMPFPTDYTQIGLSYQDTNKQIQGNTDKINSLIPTINNPRLAGTQAQADAISQKQILDNQNGLLTSQLDYSDKQIKPLWTATKPPYDLMEEVNTGLKSINPNILNSIGIIDGVQKYNGDLYTKITSMLDVLNKASKAGLITGTLPSMGQSPQQFQINLDVAEAQLLNNFFSTASPNYSSGAQGTNVLSDPTGNPNPTSLKQPNPPLSAPVTHGLHGTEQQPTNLMQQIPLNNVPLNGPNGGGGGGLPAIPQQLSQQGLPKQPIRIPQKYEYR